jgi:hypothetical protein
MVIAPKDHSALPSPAAAVTDWIAIFGVRAFGSKASAHSAQAANFAGQFIP